MEWINYFLTFINVLFAYFLLRETIKLRKVETEPEISIFLEKSPSGENFDILVKNIGKGSAYNLKFTYDNDPDILKQYKYFKINELGFFNGVKYMAPNQQYRTFFGGYAMFAKPLPPPLNINAEYFNKSGSLIKDNFVINTSEYWGTLSLQTTKLNDINKSLMEISKNINNLQKKIWIYLIPSMI